MKIISYSVHNVLKISDVDLSMDGANLVLVGGSNGQGKTSALKALLMALCGRRELGADWPDIALKEGEDEGWVKVHLTTEGAEEDLHEPEGIVVEMHLRRKRGGVVAEEFRVLDSTGEEAPEPRALLRRLYQFRAFDPLDFERSKPKEREQILRSLVGLDFEAMDEERKKLYTERTVINSAGKSKKAQLDSLEVAPGTPDEPISIKEIFDDLEQAQNANRALENEKRAALLEKNSLNDSLDKLSAEREKLEVRLATIIPEIKKASDDLLDSTLEWEKVLKEEPIDLTPLQATIANADKINREVDKKCQYIHLDAEVAQLRLASQKLTNELQAIDDAKQNMMMKALWPLPNMSIDDSGVLLNGLPFEQASKAERVLASVKVGMALNPKLRLLVCEDGNDLDNDTMAALEKSLKDNDFQMLLEFVTRDVMDEMKCAVVFQDGQRKPKSFPAKELAASLES